MSIESERRAIGQRLTESRATIRDSMRASRASTFKRDLNTLETIPRKEPGLRVVEPRGARPATVGESYWSSSKEPAAGGGIASPITEPSAAAREFWGAAVIATSDGIFTLEIEPIKKVVMQDANSVAAVFEYAEP